ncbi:putative FBD-associated F-box protein [Prunus yedoensis var. nudiflora]|uniref:Putative FBD-associated F-box protein n=1 Tax=Prunus yedoensis var. nudiflora TaxID=2094558 RepID=A0A314UJ81_PRUYE|nr:putative FBD-associated F-box protein [Prunus yedoensis var. nudiflora]
MDRISQLPESIMQQILFRLPAQDAVRMSFLSTTWKSLWNSLPVSEFNFYMESEDGLHLKRKRSEEESVTSVDESLRVLHQHEDQKRIINFRLRGTLHKKEQASDIDRWIKLVIKHYVQVLELDINKLFNSIDKLIPRYSFPPASSDLGSLVVLRLNSYCDISKEALKQEGMRFSCLKELSLSNVDLNGLTNELLSRCPSIENLNFKLCKNLKDLRLCGFSKLKNVYLATIRAHSYKIEASNLQTLRYYNFLPQKSHLDLEAINCSNLKELIMEIPSGEISLQYIETLLLKFPFLEKINLSVSYKSTKLKILSHQLKALTLNFQDDTMIKKISIKTPNLVSYKYIGHEFPLSFSLNSMKLEKVDLTVKPRSAIGTSWFLHLQEYLGKFTPKQGLSLTVFSPPVIRFAREELREETSSPVSKIKYLRVCLIRSSIDHTALIDGLLWICRPITLYIFSVEKNLAIKDLYKKLMSYGETNLLCCKDNLIKCWQHDLKSVKIEGFDGIKDGRRVIGREGLARRGLLRNLEEVSTIF